jgi:hypothetical protein
MVYIGLCLCIGLLLAQRFKFPIVVVATMAVLIFTIASGSGTEYGFWWKSLIDALAGVGLQFGYLLGLAVRFLASGIRDSWVNDSLPDPARPRRRPAH